VKQGRVANSSLERETAAIVAAVLWRGVAWQATPEGHLTV
jgi:hypothetical protein